MTKTVFEPSIASRPVYGVLQPRSGYAHLMIADAEGAEALLDLFVAAPADLPAASHVIYIPKQTGRRWVEAFDGLAPAQFYAGPTYEASVPRLRKALHDARMGLQVYLAGTEGLIGQAMREATDAGIPHEAIQTEHRGSTARRMQCVHCKGITEDVTHDPFVCAHCGLNLFVRDHYSRRMAAFQAVCVDAENPGDIPPTVERFK
ncbi:MULTISPECIES: dimethylamine monooxygenase subunit DmmA family protein [unclassified Aurantimonas]|uniref:dimethylamine monooxygenase subunit DmmA family protein n=1 Tax=unclassified Aurantimonas TaxID=2638230 RepID=UPI002E174E19|nr:dimethylamine monooxygenase subunit DmmA family protein [Aurantimonas sp. A3-2-R12]